MNQHNNQAVAGPSRPAWEADAAKGAEERPEKCASCGAEAETFEVEDGINLCRMCAAEFKRIAAGA